MLLAELDHAIQQISADNVPVLDDNLFEEMRRNCVLYRVCIARTVHCSDIAPVKQSEQVISAAHLNEGQTSAGVGFEFQVGISMSVALCTYELTS